MLTGLQIGTAPRVPTHLVGRDEDLRKLKGLLIPPESQERGVVRLMGDLIKRLRHGIRTDGGTLTQAQLGERAKISEEVVRKAENNRIVRRSTASAIAQVFHISVEELIAHPSEAVGLHSLVVVRGLPGVGKTSLAATLVHDRSFTSSFDGCLWASLGQSPHPLSQLAAWGRALGLNDIDRETDKKHARERLTAVLSNRRLLIVIDDAWTAEAAINLMVGGARCATLVTTRVREVANELAPSEDELYPLDVLTVEASVKLLERLAASVVAHHREDARELARALERLPLALQVAGRLLREESQKGLGLKQLLTELRDAVKLLSKKAPVDTAGTSEMTPTVGALLRKSTDVLDSKAQKCFAYLAPFPEKPATFDMAALKHMWKGITNNQQQMADLLVARGLLEPQSDGCFWLHALLLAHAKSLLASKSRRAVKRKTR